MRFVGLTFFVGGLAALVALLFGAEDFAVLIFAFVAMLVWIPLVTALGMGVLYLARYLTTREER